VNNAPTLTTPSTVAYTDTVGVDSFSTITGGLDGADVDPGDVLTYTIVSGTDGGTTVERVGTYGTLTVTKSSGGFVFVPNATAINARAADVTETHTVTVTDGIQTTSATFTISISAVNDEPVMTNVTQAFADTAANDAQTVRFGTFSATDAESNTISSWSMTGATVVSDLLAWSSGSITFDRKLEGTHGTLFIQSSSGKYRFEPNNVTINGRVADGSETWPVTVTDSASVTGNGTLTANMTATNDRPIVTVTVSTLDDVTAGLSNGAYTPYHASDSSGGSSPGGEEVHRAFDNSQNTKYLNFSGPGSGVTIDLGSGTAAAVTGLGLTTANDASERDPTSYQVFGSNDGASFTLVSSGNLTAPTARYTAYADVAFTNSTTYRWYRIVFPTTRGGGMMQIAEIRLPARSGNPLTYTEASPAGVVLTGIDVTDADTSTLVSATVAITAGLTTGDVLAFTNDGATMGSITGDFDAGTGVLALTGTATAAQYQSAFRAVTFRNTTNNPTVNSTTRTVAWRTNDGQVSDNLSTPSTSTITVIETVPRITSTVFTSTSGSDSLYGIGDTMTVAMTFTEDVFVTGTPRVPINGLTGRFLSYSSGSGSPTLVFAYTVASGDAAPSGTGLTANTLVLNGGTIRDSVSANATLTHLAVSTLSAHAVDGVTATIPTFSSALATPTNLTTLTYTVTFSESMTGVGPDDFTNSGTAENCVFDPGTDTGSTRTLTVTSCGGGTVVPVFAANGAVDAAGNPAPLAPSTSTSSINRRFVRTISFAVTSFTKTYGDVPFSVVASPSRGTGDGAVTYTVISGPCT
ncbi:MAG: discoidin domain-containing protein, partial [Ilumatobacteraceae bacterium]|nr:discoidin domain-containing protein [Ilumatobacteraceae bacterium]